jgi:hypothetical protein
VVVVAGATVVDPLADVEVNDPGVMVMLVAPVVANESVELKPASILVGLAVNVWMVGLVAAKHDAADATSSAQRPIEVETRPGTRIGP